MIRLDVLIYWMTDQPTNRPTDMRGHHREVKLPLIQKHTEKVVFHVNLRANNSRILLEILYKIFIKQYNKKKVYTKWIQFEEIFFFKKTLYFVPNFFCAQETPCLGGKQPLSPGNIRLSFIVWLPLLEKRRTECWGGKLCLVFTGWSHWVVLE